MKILGDFGTTWTKLLDMERESYEILKTREYKTNSSEVFLGTGHNAERLAEKTVNELSALVSGGKELVKENEFYLLDVGSRDMKFVCMKNGELKNMDWNNNCGAMTGFTLELLGSYYSIDFNDIEPSDSPLPVTCGLLGIERIFDMTSRGVPVEKAVSSFARGLALNAHRFIGKKKRFYLSGGMCDNPLFLNSFPEDVEVIPLGRFVLLEGLKEYLP